ncbi:DDE domain protein [uncultured archaeon]|nr:DDE domain protein [uncultured archaeon]
MWRADEAWIKVKGDLKNFFALMDDETRYWISQEVADIKDMHGAGGLFKEGREIAGRRPETLITDCLQSYHVAFKKEFYSNNLQMSQHINAIRLKGSANNNKMERINGELMDREKTMSSLKKRFFAISCG